MRSSLESGIRMNTSRCLLRLKSAFSRAVWKGGLLGDDAERAVLVHLILPLLDHLWNHKACSAGSPDLEAGGSADGG